MFSVFSRSACSLFTTSPASIRYLAFVSLVKIRALPAHQTPFHPHKPSRALVAIEMDTSTANWNDFLNSEVSSDFPSTNFGLQGGEAG